MSNNLDGLTARLFEQLDRLNDPGLTPDQLEREAARARTMVAVAGSIQQNAKMQLEASHLLAEYGRKEVSLPPAVAGTK